MLFWLADYFDYAGILNLFRYLTFRAGAAVGTALVIGMVIGPKFISMLRVRQGKGQPIIKLGKFHPLVAPSVRPAMKCFCIKKNMATGGKAAMIEAAEINSQATLYWPLSSFMPAVTGLTDASCAMTVAQK